MKRSCAVLAMVKNEGVFMPFWLRHYGSWFAPKDLYVHSDGSTDSTEELVRQAHANFVAVPPGTIAVGKNNVYVKDVITGLLKDYECVLFAESPDDIIVPGAAHDHDLRSYVADFISSEDRYRFLTGINVVQGRDEPAYDPFSKLLANRSVAVRCNQYDNPFLWKDTPLWGRGWHDLGGKRITGGGDTQGETKRLYNLHIHYADFDLCNARHHVRQVTFTPEQKAAYMCKVDDDLRTFMLDMGERPERHFSEGRHVPMAPWMRAVI